ncbi:MAG: MFS transporter [Ilumatobacteraceae bacterium]
MLRLLRTNPDLRWLFAAQVVSFLGDWFVFVALAGYVDDATDSELLVSLVLVSFALPSFIASPLAGPLVDRVDRRRLLIVVCALQALAASGLLLLREDRIWVAFLFQGLVAALAAFVKPAIEAAVPNLVRSPEELRTANALFGSTWGVMLAVGAGLGGLFSQAFGRRAAIVADVATFVIAAALITMVRRPMQQPRASTGTRVRPIADMREAIALARRDRVVLALMSSKATFAIGAGVVSQLVVLASEIHGAGDRGRGLLLAARGVGSGVGPFLAARWAKGTVNRIVGLCGWAAIVFSVAYLGAAWAPTLLLTSVLIVIAHLGGGAQWTLSTYGLQVEVEDRVLGRILAGDFAIVTLVLSVTSVGAGALAMVVGVRWAITCFALAAAIAGSAYLALTRDIRRGAGRSAPAPADAVT